MKRILWVLAVILLCAITFACKGRTPLPPEQPEEPAVVEHKLEPEIEETEAVAHTGAAAVESEVAVSYQAQRPLSDFSG